MEDLKQLNAEFLQGTWDRKMQLLMDLPVIIMFVNGKATLYGKGLKELASVDYLPPRYHKLKMICHAAVRLSELDPKHPSCLRATEMLDELSKIFSEKDLDLQRKIISCSLDREENAKDRTVRLCNLLAQNTRLAVTLQGWKSITSAEDWNRAWAVVMGPKMPRIGDVHMQYVSFWAGKQTESNQIWTGPEVKQPPYKKDRRVLYVECIGNEARPSDALQVLGDQLVAEEISNRIFSHPDGLSVDLLAEFAAEHLRSKCPHVLAVASKDDSSTATEEGGEREEEDEKNYDE